MRLWRTAGPREQRVFGITVLVVAFALLAALGSSLAALAVLVAGLALRPGHQGLMNRIAYPAVLVGAYIVASVLPR
jgi:hydrogenase-4 membrane subunit HyfE